MHWPVAFKTNKDISKLFPTSARSPDFVEIDDDIPIQDTWKGKFGWGSLTTCPLYAALSDMLPAMIELPKSKVRAIGVSNSLIEHVCSLRDPCHARDKLREDSLGGLYNRLKP
jgi:L-glyceraldehyde reductase